MGSISGAGQRELNTIPGISNLLLATKLFKRAPISDQIGSFYFLSTSIPETRSPPNLAISCNVPPLFMVIWASSPSEDMIGIVEYGKLILKALLPVAGFHNPAMMEPPCSLKKKT